MYIMKEVVMEGKKSLDSEILRARHRFCVEAVRLQTPPIMWKVCAMNKNWFFGLLGNQWYVI